MFQTTVLVLILAALAQARSVLDPNAGNGPSNSPSKRKDVLMNNWCGPVKQVDQVSSVGASWKVPSVSRQRGTTDDNWFYHWVGIDGVGNCNVLLQAGTGSTIYQSYTDTYAWYEFYPGNMTYAREVPVAVGDSVYVSVVATSATTGTIYIENQTNQKSHTYYLQSDFGPLCLQHAEWIAEAPGKPLPNFSTFTMSGAKGTTSGGRTFDMQGSDMDYMEYYGPCHSQLESGSDVTFYNSVR
ncbi:peptidase a4 family domain-containing protein [Purpureocillium lavendulum]|uniref:Peptidase a4 family domain-containing protein n=1 Tax=Purpureocillium lavendulum TaxID=1247861 RepID=A0AB34G6A0_9HYPO|nr:peptidase a4 family domain-containing protein [Purpureocillium lavendulum]